MGALRLVSVLLALGSLACLAAASAVDNCSMFLAQYTCWSLVNRERIHDISYTTSAVDLPAAVGTQKRAIEDGPHDTITFGTSHSSRIDFIACPRAFRTWAVACNVWKRVAKGMQLIRCHELHVHAPAVVRLAEGFPSTAEQKQKHEKLIWDMHKLAMLVQALRACRF